MIHKKLIFPLMIFGLFSVTGCTAIDVEPVDSTVGLKHVCIEENSKVKVADFIPVLREGFDRHNITTEVYAGTVPGNCEFTLKYTALRSWDLAPYMTVAELNLDRYGTSVASAKYHLRGKGGFALTKYQGTRKKLTPVIDELLQNV